MMSLGEDVKELLIRSKRYEDVPEITSILESLDKDCCYNPMNLRQGAQSCSWGGKILTKSIKEGEKG
ncbi:hypothetical protein G5714_012743 [Onychostoma macrolepis]|uniref:Uncharacterized protein n=1 Tax=Onychostoma macrolepis TaxID=369639 RepID=A0A7J6CJQ5_9TELE|nr:hypothetical protein G5714_012743 [Onychostoma macrolepis]